MKTLAATLMLTAAFGVAGGKDRDWQNGTLLDPVLNHFFENASNDPKNAAKQNYNGFQYQQNNSTTQTTADRYVIETEELVYMVERVRLTSAKPAALVRYHPVKFVVEKSSKLILLDDEGKEYATKIVKLAQKKPANEIQAKSEATQQ
jgi:hypothetical protein